MWTIIFGILRSFFIAINLTYTLYTLPMYFKDYDLPLIPDLLGWADCRFGTPGFLVSLIVIGLLLLPTILLHVVIVGIIWLVSRLFKN